MYIDRSWIKQLGRAAAALLLLGLAAQADSREPFGLVSAPAPEGPLWVTWRNLQSEMKAEHPLIAQCRAAPQSCPSASALRFIAIIAAGADYKGFARIAHLNRAANLSIRQIDSATLAGYRDRWTSPLATLAAGVGNCKKYAVLKYAVLRDAGFAADDVRIVILQSRTRLESHAVVTARNEGNWLILDNRSMTIVDSRVLLDRYLPIFMLDRSGVRQFPPQVAQNSHASCAG